ncbi:FCD domain-containing protein [Bosea thiooxidans]
MSRHWAALAAASALSAPVDDPERFALALRQHRAILDAIIARDAGAASDAPPAFLTGRSSDWRHLTLNPSNMRYRPNRLRYGMD